MSRGIQKQLSGSECTTGAQPRLIQLISLPTISREPSSQSQMKHSIHRPQSSLSGCLLPVLPGPVVFAAIKLQMQLEETQSFELESSPALEYERCEYCARNFFKGKLKYHLKLCTQDAPMTISPKRTARLPPANTTQKALIQEKQEKDCPNCKVKIPNSIFQSHVDRCALRDTRADSPEPASPGVNPKSTTEVNFKGGGSPRLPAIKRSGQAASKEPYQVKLREELSCFRRAQDIKQVQCPTCTRIFSREAALRHLPICQALRDKERLSIALRRRGNRSVGEQHAHRGEDTHRGGQTYRLAKQRAEERESVSALEVNPERSDSPN